MAGLMVRHENLGVDFLIKIDVETFKNRMDDSIIECFDVNDNCRKFLKSYLTLLGQPAEEPKKIRKKRIPRDSSIDIETDNVIAEEVRKDIDIAAIPDDEE